MYTDAGIFIKANARHMQKYCIENLGGEGRALVNAVFPRNKEIQHYPALYSMNNSG